MALRKCPTWINTSYISLLTFASLVSGICYYPDGSVSPQDTACSDTEENSTCCGQGYACLTNNICMATGDETQKQGATLYVRGSCTDQSWRSNSCPLFCIDPKLDLLAGGMGIGKCYDSARDSYYCIDGALNQVNCTTETNVLVFQGEPSILTTIGVTATSASPTSYSSSTSSTLPPYSSFLTSSFSQSVTTTPTASGSPTAGIIAPAEETTAPSTHKHTAAIAAGVVVPVVAIIIGFMIFMFFRRKRAQRSNTVQGDPSDPQTQNPPQYHSVTQKAELPATSTAYETVPQYDMRYELPANMTPR